MIFFESSSKYYLRQEHKISRQKKNELKRINILNKKCLVTVVYIYKHS